MSNLAYRRIVLKLSGEALAGEKKKGFDMSVCRRIVGEIVNVMELGAQIAIVVGGGNMFRGRCLRERGVTNATGDQIGMLATVMNGLFLCDVFRERRVVSALMTAVVVQGVGEVFTRKNAEASLERGEIVILVGGTGNPFFSTDTAACLRAAEINAELVIKGTRVDGVFAHDPELRPQARFYDKLTYDEVIGMRLRVMDFPAIHLCREQSIPLRVCNIMKEGVFKEVALGADIGTLVSCS